MTNQKCQGLIGKIFGHKFQAQYDESGVMFRSNDLFYLDSDDASRLMEKSVPMTRTYRMTVCLRCGLYLNAT